MDLREGERSSKTFYCPGLVSMTNDQACLQDCAIIRQGSGSVFRKQLEFVPEEEDRSCWKVKCHRDYFFMASEVSV